MTAPRIHLLGPLRLTLGERSVALAPGPMAALLGCLALHAANGRAASRSRIAGLLWPDLPETAARRNLSDSLYRLRRAIGEDAHWLAASEGDLRLESVWLDVDEFRARAGSSELNDRRTALDLYAGDLLDDLDADWLLGSRAELRDRYLSLLESVCAAQADSGDLAEALGLAHRWTLADPFSETAHRMAMRLYARLGRHAAALQQYDRLARLLDDELGIEPLPETRTLAASIRADAAGPARPALRPFVGRRRERATLLELVERAQAGTGGLVLLEGEAGIGKTRLLDEVAEGAEWRGLSLAWGRAVELAGIAPFSPLDSALQSAIAGPRADQLRPLLPPETLDALTGLLPRLNASTLHSPPSTVLPPTLPPPPSTALPSALAECLRALAELSPHVFLFDDVQWADIGFWDAMQQVLPGLESRCLLIVLAFRSQAVRANPAAWEALRTIDREHAPLKMVLSGLGPNECAQLAAQADRPLDSAALLDLHGRTGGNPFFLRESLEASGSASVSLSGLIEWRLAMLSPPARAALEAGAVLGREFNHGPWQAVAGAEALNALSDLAGARFVVEGERGYAFQHDLTREHVYRSIPPDRLRDLHRRAGEALRRERAEPAALGYHFERAERWPEAVRHYREAGERAAQSFAFDAAVAHYRRAIDLSARLRDPEPECLGLWLRLQRVYRITVREPEWRAAVDELERAAAAANDRPALLEAEQARVSLHLLAADWRAMQATADRAIRLAQAIGDRAAEAQTRAELGWHLADMIGRPVEALPHLERAAALAEQLDDTPLRLDVLGHLAFAYRMLGRSSAARQAAGLALALAAGRPEHRKGTADALEALGQVEIDLAHWQAARDTMAQFVEHCRELKDRWSLGQGLFNQAFIASRMGQHAEAQAHLRGLKSLLTEAGLGPPADHWMWTEALSTDALVLAGQLDEAERALAGMRAWIESKQDGRPLLAALTALGRLHLARGRAAEARACLERAVRVWEASGGTIEVAPLLLLTLAAQRAGDGDAARASLRRAEEALGQTEVAAHNVLLHFVQYELSRDPTHLAAARDEIQRQAGWFTDPELRAGFLRDVLLHRAIERHWEPLHPAPVPVTARLARADAPLGKALTDADRVEVRWTVDAGESDAGILRAEGKVALRRHRLRRLLDEASAQGTAPTDSDLARALGVNVRTIERDMAALRLEGTRRRKSEVRSQRSEVGGQNLPPPTSDF